ncbi:MAG TPA: hypothetical protein DCF62_12345 [Porticoccaceae bacterium]|nr:hypothetical protein [Porticoccaceae bacterium]
MSAPITTARLRYSFFSNWYGIAFGTLESALQRVIDGIGSKILSFSGHSLRDQVPTQEWIVNSKAALRAARAGHLEAMGAVWQAVQYGEEVRCACAHRSMPFTTMRSMLFETPSVGSIPVELVRPFSRDIQ